MHTVDLKITLSDQVAREARDAGLLTQRGIKRLIEDAVRREAGRKLLDAMQRLRDAEGPPLTEDDIAAEVAAVHLRRRCLCAHSQVRDVSADVLVEATTAWPWLVEPSVLRASPCGARSSDFTFSSSV